jgi:cytochrome c peroxidase
MHSPRATIPAAMRALATVFTFSLLSTACGDSATSAGPAQVETKAGRGLPADTKAKPDGQSLPAPDATKLMARAKQTFAPLPEVVENPDNPITDEKIELGRMLYYDKRLSKNHDVSCESCHPLLAHGSDGQPTSLGHKQQRGERNAPTVYNAGLHLAQFWDGRAADLEEQAKGPILNPVEMALPDEAAAVATIESIPGYVDAFDKAFPGQGVTYDNMAKAIGAFERKLFTPGPFDAFLGGDAAALDTEALQGLQLFFDAACTTCHTGAALGGAMYQKLGSVVPYPTKDEGRFAVTKADADKHVFKVPSLRNIDKTGPYLHDGSVETLEAMVGIMVKHQTAKGSFSEPETKAMLAFLKALTGPLPKDYVAEPALPESGPDTPKPDPS